MLIEIKHRYTNKVLFACEAENMRAAVILALGKVADLRGANLRGVDLRDVDLQIFKTDFFDTLLRAPKEIDGLRNALVEGRVNGLLYEGDCACLKGTIANIRQCHYKELGAGMVFSASLPAEQWFTMIKEGDTPENNQASRLSVEWLDEFKLLLEAAK